MLDSEFLQGEASVMVRMSRFLTLWRTGALVAVAGLIGAVSLDTAAYAQSAAEVQARLRRLERDIRDLQAETFRKSPDAAASVLAAPPTPSEQAATEPSQPMPDLGPMMRRVDEIEASVTRLTGQMEELGHRIDQLATQTERMQKQMEFDATQRANAQISAAPPPGDQIASAAPPPNDTLPGSAPPAPTTPGVLGQIPAGSTLPTPAPAPDPKRDFDTAMNLLSRAQYDDASDAFRKFAETNPEDERASAALYWTGDIAYSAKKDYASAAREFAELLKKYPMAPRAPDSMLKLGLSLFQLGQMNEGCAALAALPAKYPQASPAITTRARNERRDAMCR
jgi:tol-pal system protein YbgF